MPQNMKSMGFLQFCESFRGNIYKKYSTGNEEWIEFETATITSDYVHNHRDRGGGGAGRAAALPLFCAPAPTF